jgi:hypothetical protein
MRQSAATRTSASEGTWSTASPQQAHAAPLRAAISTQQQSQIGTGESRGRSKPQREHEAGSRAQPSASTGLRNTRATARQRVVGDCGRSNVSGRASRRKTHLDSGQQCEAAASHCPVRQVYSNRKPRSRLIALPDRASRPRFQTALVDWRSGAGAEGWIFRGAAQTLSSRSCCPNMPESRPPG